MDFIREGTSLKEKWIALIPAYKPDKELPDLLYGVRRAGFEIVIVDDGSGKDYEDVFQNCSKYAVVLTIPENRGKGRALKTGFEYIQKHFGEDYIVTTMDSDGQHKVNDAKKICQMAQNYPDSLVLGSRWLKEHVPMRSRFGNAVTRLIYRLSTGVQVHDTQTGLRAFHSRLLPKLKNIPGERYEYEMNVLLECSRQHIPIREIEIETIYINNNSKSHFNTIQDSYRIYREIIKFSASSFISFLVDYVLYSILIILTSGWGASSLWLSNIIARIVSATVNYTINRTLVFKNKNNVAKSILQYVALAVAILIGNTIMLSLLVVQFGINKYVAKICTELFFFGLSWMIQRGIIFRRK